MRYVIHTNSRLNIKNALFYGLMILTLWSGAQSSSYKESDLKRNIASHLHKGSYFIENKGQRFNTSPGCNIFYELHGPGLRIYVTDKGLQYVYSPATIKNGQALNGGCERIEMELRGASISRKNIVAFDQAAGEFSYYNPRNPGGVKNVHAFHSLRIAEVYPGIDWLLYSNENGFKYDFVVKDGASPRDIELVYRSRSRPFLAGDGSLNIKTAFAGFREESPYSYRSGDKSRIPSAFAISSRTWMHDHFESVVKFSLATSDQGGFVIDPLMVWSTFIGGQQYDEAVAIESDNSGNIYVTGYTASADFPVMNGGGFYQSAMSNTVQAEIFIMKFSSSGALLWSTYYGGTAFDRPYGMCLDNSGNLYVTGSTASPDLPVQNAGGFFQGTHGGGNTSQPMDAFILKFNSSGTRLWATYYGGNGTVDERGCSVAADASGNVFVSGHSDSFNFPVQNSGGYFQSNVPLPNISAFILKFSSSTARLWGSYIAGAGSSAQSLITDASGNIYLAGYALSSCTIPATNPGSGAYYQSTHAGLEDGIIYKFSNSGNLLWSTYYGGAAADRMNTIERDAVGNIFIAGTTASSNFPLINSGAYYKAPPLGAVSDAFILKIGSGANAVWGTCLGGSATEGFSNYDALCVDNCGNIIVSFETGSTNIPVRKPCDGGYIDSVFSAGSETMLVRLSTAGALMWSTFISGDGQDKSAALEIDAAGNLYCAGMWVVGSSSSYPLLNPGGPAFYDGSYNGNSDAFLVKFTMTPTIVPQSFSYVSPVCNSQAMSSPVKSSAFSEGGIYSAPSGLIMDPTTGVITLSASVPGSYVVTYSGSACGCQTIAPITATIGIVQSFTITANNATICPGNTVILTATVTPQTSVTLNWIPGGTGYSIVASPTVYTVYNVSGSSGGACFASANTFIYVYPKPSVFISGGGTICAGSSATLTAQGGLTHTWSTGSTSGTIVVSPTVTTTYSVVAVSSPGCTNSAVSNVYVKPGTEVSVPDYTICSGKSVTLTATASSTDNAFFSWTPGNLSGRSVITTPTATTVYQLTVNKNGCVQRLFTKVTVEEINTPFIAFGYPLPMCTNSGSTAPIASPDFDYGGIFTATPSLPIDSATGRIQLSEVAEGAYNISYTISPKGCDPGNSHTITVNIYRPGQLSLPERIRLRGGDAVTLSAGGTDLYQWSPPDFLSCTNCSEPLANPPQNIRYCVLSISNSCFSSACVDVEVYCENIGDLSIPNAFTPNSDGNNDEFCLKGWSECLSSFSIKIFDRWGEKVYESADPEFCWNGLYNGTLLPSGVYVYMVKAVFNNDPEITKRGNITLIR